MENSEKSVLCIIIVIKKYKDLFSCYNELLAIGIRLLMAENT